MNDPQSGGEPVDRGTAPASTVVVRWWFEARQGATPDERDERSARGTVRDLNGHTLGAFGGFDALVALLHRLVSDSRRRRS